MSIDSAPQPGAEEPVSIEVAREHDVPQVVGAARRFCQRVGATSVVAAQVATVASELANNLWMHTTHGGHIRLRMRQAGGRRGIEVRSEDDGPGIPDIPLAMQEGFSTAGGLGYGLPGAQRLMDEFHIDSAAGRGTTVVGTKWLPPAAPAHGWRR